MGLHFLCILCLFLKDSSAVLLIYKRLKLGGGQAYDRSSDWSAVVAGVN
jgi:hypothetical protein